MVQVTFNRLSVGSSPTGSTINIYSNNRSILCLKSEKQQSVPAEEQQLLLNGLDQAVQLPRQHVTLTLAKPEPPFEQPLAPAQLQRNGK